MRALPVLILCLATGGCLPLQTYYRAGASVDRVKSDQLKCEVKALKDAPVATQTRISPPRYIAPRRYCDTQGKCVTRGGFFVPGDVYTVDVNADLRSRLEVQCMAERGYQPARIPLCPSGIARKAPSGATKVLPTLTEKSCAIRNSDGSFQIVTRG